MAGASVRRAGTAGLALAGLSIALTFTVALLGPSLLEPALAGPPGQPPWSLAAHPSATLVVALTAAAVAAGTAGLVLMIRAMRRGWAVSPWLILAAGVVAAAALTLVPPFGSSDHLSYAAYGRMVATGHDPYTTTPAALARLGDPVGRAVQDWRSSPSVYGALATVGQALASLIGGASVRATVFVLSVLNFAAFTLTGLLLHRLGRGDRQRQLRAALLWTANPLLLQVLVAGAHLDSQAVLFAIGALYVLRRYLPGTGHAGHAGRAGRRACVGGAAGVAAGAGFAVKPTMVLAAAGLAVACVLAAGARRQPGAAGGWRDVAPALGGLAAGFAASAGAAVVIWGPHSLAPALRAGSYVSVGSPWRAVRSLLRLAVGEGAAESVVKTGAAALALALAGLLIASIRRSEPGSWPEVPGLAPAAAPAGAAPEDAAAPGGRARADAGLSGAALLMPAAAFAVTLAWLVAWPYVLPWYDSLAWALLALLPTSRLDWLMLARTTALALGYLPARGVVVPASLRWLETVGRSAITPAVLLAAAVVLVVMIWPGRTTGKARTSAARLPAARRPSA